MSRFHRTVLASLMMGLSAFASSLHASEVNADVTRAADFTLLDQQGKAFNLHYHGQRPAVVLMAHVTGSDYARDSLNTLLKEIAPQDKGIALALINPESGMGRQALMAFASANAIEQSVLQDEAWSLPHLGCVLPARRW